MSEASEKQTAILLKNGFSQEEINGWNKAKVSEEIGKIFDKSGYKSKKPSNPSNGQIATTQGIAKVEHEFQSEYEFGPAGNRHKIKYRTIEELKNKMKELEEAGYFIEHEKI